MRSIRALSRRHWRKVMNRVEEYHMKVKMIRKGILIIAVILILMGLKQNGFDDIKNKAARICYECIGIG